MSSHHRREAQPAPARPPGRLAAHPCPPAPRTLTPAGQPVLLPLTESLYVSGKLESVDTVLLEIGTGYYVEVRRRQRRQQQYCRDACCCRAAGSYAAQGTCPVQLCMEGRQAGTLPPLFDN